MLYVMCKAKNEISQNEENPIFNSENQEILEYVKCRKNATLTSFNKVFSPIYQRLSEEHKKENKYVRFWHFRSDEITV